MGMGPVQGVNDGRGGRPGDAQTTGGPVKGRTASAPPQPLR